MTAVEINERGPELIAQLLLIWERSVQATHTFLSGEEIAKIKPYVPQALEQVPHLIVLEDEVSAAFVAKPEHREEIERLIAEKTGKQMEVDVRQVEEGRRFEDSFVDIEKLIHMDITIED